MEHAIKMLCVFVVISRNFNIRHRDTEKIHHEDTKAPRTARNLFHDVLGTGLKAAQAHILIILLIMMYY